MLAEAAELEGVDEVFPVSARSGEGLDVLVERLGELVPEGPYMYPPQDHSDQSSELLLAELIREQVLNRTREEIPHSVEVSVGEVTERDDGLVTVKAEIWVETESQKGILIGRDGSKVGEIGAAARRSLEGRARRQGPPRPPGQPPPPLAPGRGSCSIAWASNRRRGCLRPDKRLARSESIWTGIRSASGGG